MSEEKIIDPRVIEIRKKFLDYVQSKIDILDPYIPEKLVRKSLSRWRKIMTTPEKRWPKLDALYAEVARHNIPRHFEYIEFHPLQATSEIQRLKDLLEFPQTYHDNWDDIHPKLDHEGKPMMKIQELWDFTLKDKQTNKTSHTEYGEGQVEMDPIDSKRFKNKYKKYVKEWKEEND